MIGGNRVGLIAREESVRFIRQNGLELLDLEGRHHLQPEVDLASGFSAADILFLCSKSQDLPQLSLSVRHLITPETVVVPLINGLPWWYFDGENGMWNGDRIRAVDPDNILKATIPSRQVIGTTTVMTVERVNRGMARTFNRLQMTLGELDDQPSARVAALAGILENAGFTVHVAPRIRDAVWTKIVRNLISNPLTAITGATLRENFGDPFLADVSRRMLEEILPLIAACGAKLDATPESILELGKSMGDVKTSMLQDLERGRELELAAVCDAVVELARLRNIAMPVTEAIGKIAHFRSSRQQASAA
jgi:2-dehydropantoate 2-reductase